MPSKTEEYLALAQRTANGLTRYWESWTDYLTTASRLYKYPFADQLMIYAQRPDATACADFDIWNNRMNRYVRRGAKGIALLDESSGFPRLHYVFDVSDTGVRRNSRDPEVWQYNDDLKQPVSEMLSKTYGISGERVSQQLADVAGKLVADYWDNNGEDIRAIVDDSLLMDYDEAGVEMGNGVESPGKFSAWAGQHPDDSLFCAGTGLCDRCGHRPDGHQRQKAAQVHCARVCGVHPEHAAAAVIVLFVLRTGLCRPEPGRDPHRHHRAGRLHRCVYGRGRPCRH